MSQRLPFEIREAIVAVCGKAFWLKDPFRDFLISCGVRAGMYDRYADESKFKIARHVLSELDALKDEGFLIQRKILTELTNLRRVPDQNVPDMDEAVRSLRNLKELAISQKLVTQQEKDDTAGRVEESRKKQEAITARAHKMEQLRRNFYSLVQGEDPQARGYALEGILAELFEAHEIGYRRSYRTTTEQIDGHFTFREFDYIVEARWRSTSPNEADLGAFKTKVDKKIASTRGLFVSITGFRNEMVQEFTRGVTSNIILMDGADLTLILEGHVSLTDALEFKIQKAAQEGILFFPLSQRFTIK